MFCEIAFMLGCAVGEPSLELTAPNGALLLEVDMSTGITTFGPAYKDKRQAAREFWNILGMRKEICGEEP